MGDEGAAGMMIEGALVAIFLAALIGGAIFLDLLEKWRKAADLRERKAFREACRRNEGDNV